jgi:hypothetical protein
MCSDLEAGQGALRGNCVFDTGFVLCFGDLSWRANEHPE